MARRPKALSPAVLRAVHRELIESTGLDFPLPLIREVIAREPELEREVRLSKGGLDTDVRELFEETVSQLLIGESWPLMGDEPGRAKKTLARFRKAAEARGVKFPEPRRITKIETSIEPIGPGLVRVTPKGRIDGSNYTTFSSACLKGAAGDEPRGIALDFGRVEWDELDHALFALQTTHQNANFFIGPLVAFGVDPKLVVRQEELKPKLAAEMIVEIAGSEADAVARLRRR